MSCDSGNIYSECPKAPPARREGSSVLAAMNSIVFRKPANALKEKRTIRATANRSFLIERALFRANTMFIDCPVRAASACSRRSNGLFEVTADRSDRLTQTADRRKEFVTTPV